MLSFITMLCLRKSAHLHLCYKCLLTLVFSTKKRPRLSCRWSSSCRKSRRKFSYDFSPNHVDVKFFSGLENSSDWKHESLLKNATETRTTRSKPKSSDNEHEKREQKSRQSNVSVSECRTLLPVNRTPTYCSVAARVFFSAPTRRFFASAFFRGNANWPACTYSRLRTN